MTSPSDTRNAAIEEIADYLKSSRDFISDPDRFDDFVRWEEALRALPAASSPAPPAQAEAVAIPTCCVTGAIAGDGGACGDCDPCIIGEARVPASVKRLIAEKNSLLNRLGELQDALDAMGEPGAWHGADEPPPVEGGCADEFILAVYRSHSGKVHTFAASYLNAFPVEYEFECPKGHGCEGIGCDDGCPTTGWFTQTGDDNYSSMFNRLHLRDGDKIMGWAEIPQWLASPPVTTQETIPDGYRARKLLELADRVEKLTGPDRAVDCAIGVALGWFEKTTRKFDPDPCYVDLREGRRVAPGNGGDWLVPRYTESLDAAMTLALPGYSFHLNSGGHMGETRCYAIPEGPDNAGVADPRKVEGRAPLGQYARAVAAMWLRSRAQEEG